MRRVLCLLILVFVSTACDGNDTKVQPAKPTPAPAPESLIEVLIARDQSVARLQPFNSIAGTLDNTLYQVEGGKPHPLTEAVVVGEVIGVEAGIASGPGGRKDFDDPDANYRTIHVRLSVSDVISGDPPRELVFGLALDPRLPLTTAETELKELDPLLILLNRSPVFAYDASLYGTLNDGGLLGLVDENGGISLPVQGGAFERRLLRGGGTIRELHQAANAPERVVKLDASGQPLNE